MVETLVFYMFAAVLIMSSVMVISVKNPVYSVLFLIVGFFNAAGLFVLLGAEFIAMILVIVYVGAIAVLFLFVVMMLDIKVASIKKGVIKYISVGGLLGGVLLGELAWLYLSWDISASSTGNRISPTPNIDKISNTEALGNILYTENIYLFQLAGIILLVAMIGSIVLTLRVRPNVRKQNISDQISRKRNEVIEIVNVETGKGIKL